MLFTEQLDLAVNDDLLSADRYIPYFAPNSWYCHLIFKDFEMRMIGEVGQWMLYAWTFNKVSHGRLIQKVKSHGMHGELVNWIQIAQLQKLEYKGRACVMLTRSV